MANKTEMKLYTQAFLFIDGEVKAECESIQVTGDSKAVPVETITKGLAGVTRGAEQLKFSIKNAVPEAGFEMDPNKFLNNGEFYKIGIKAAGKTLETQVYLQNWSISYAVNGKAEFNIEAIGTWSEWE